MEKILIIIYAIPLIYIFSYSLVQLSLIFSYWKGKKENGEWRMENGEHRAENEKKHFLNPQSSILYSPITIQLPIYNERYVVERLIDSVAEFDYPKNLLEIQILDDSTDETTQIIAKKVKELQSKGIDIQHIRRENRVGFKAGALAHGLQICKGEFIAIFDADFLPKRDFLQKTIPYFQDKSIGVVQSRWQHINEDYSILTQLQAFGLDAHFTVEQGGRNYGNHFINFNGTAGIWRKQAIEESGGWQSDTLTEDLDLSYRSQMAGWKFIYLEDLESPAELPVTMPAIKSQQYRWMKGAAECSVKNLGRLFRAKNIDFSTKLHGFYHLMNSTGFVAVFLLGLLSVPVLIFIAQTNDYEKYFRLTALFQVSWLILGVFYWSSFQKKELGIFVFFKRFFLFLIFMMGLSFHNSVAVVEGWIGRKTPFVRTPKFNIKSKKDSWQGNQYNIRNLGLGVFVEFLLLFYFIFALFIDFSYQNYGMIPFHLMLVLGYGSIIYFDFKQG